MSRARADLRHPERHHRRDVIISYCRPDHVDGAFADWLSSMILYDRDHGQRIQGTLANATGPRLGRARCDLVRSFLALDDEGPGKPRPTWLWMLDTDMVGERDTLARMLVVAEELVREDPHVVLGALCFAGGKKTIYPTLYTFEPAGANGQITSETLLAYPADTLIRLGGTGAACTLIHRSVLEALAAFIPGPLPFYQDLVVGDQEWGEDLIFCLRAITLGCRIFVHTGIAVGHRKTVVLDQQRFVDYVKKSDAACDGIPQSVSLDQFAALAGGRL